MHFSTSLSRANLKQHDILTFKIDKKLMTGLYYPKISDTVCECEPEILFILTDLFDMYLKGSSF